MYVFLIIDCFGIIYFNNYYLRIYIRNIHLSTVHINQNFFSDINNFRFQIERFFYILQL
jgi:hypothetical protein